MNALQETVDNPYVRADFIVFLVRCTRCSSYEVHCSSGALFRFFFPEVIFFSRVFGARAVTTGRTFGDEFM